LSGVDQVEPPFDPIEPRVDPIDAIRHCRKVYMHVRNIDVKLCALRFERTTRCFSSRMLLSTESNFSSTRLRWAKIKSVDTSAMRTRYVLNACRATTRRLYPLPWTFSTGLGSSRMSHDFVTARP